MSEKAMKRYAGGRDRRGQIIGRTAVSKRPAHIEERRQIGHWEGDTLIGKSHKQAIVSLVERKSGYAVLAKVQNKTAYQVSNAIINRLKPIKNTVRTMIYYKMIICITDRYQAHRFAIEPLTFLSTARMLAFER